MKNVLVMDDEESIRNLLKTILEKEGYQVTLAENGKAGIEMINQQPTQFMLVITDLIMPESDGMEVISWIKTNHSQIKIIAMSGGARTGPEIYLPLAGMVGADITLQKPFNKTALLEAINKVTT